MEKVFSYLENSRHWSFRADTCELPASIGYAFLVDQPHQIYVRRPNNYVFI